MKPQRVWIRRFICRVVGRTVSLLPAFVAAWVRGSLEEPEEAVRVGEAAGTQVDAVEQVRPPGSAIWPAHSTGCDGGWWAFTTEFHRQNHT